MLIATKFHHIAIKRTEDREYRVAYKLDTIRDRLGVDRRRAMELQERTAAYETDREAAEGTARAMLREWQLVEPAHRTPAEALLAIAAEGFAA